MNKFFYFLNKAKSKLLGLTVSVIVCSSFIAHSQATAQSSNSCSSWANTNSSKMNRTRPDSSFFKVPGDLFMAFRSNVGFYWNFAKSISTQPGQLALLFKFKGFAVGDFHVLNIGDIELTHGERKIGLIDLDDSGENLPILIDLARGFVANSLAPKSISTDSLWRAYLKGLQNEKLDSTFVNSIKSKSADDFEKAQIKYIKKITNQNNFILSDKLWNLDQAPIEHKLLFQKRKNKFEKEINSQFPGAQVQDVKYKPKTSGGSHGSARFWYLIQTQEGRQQIVEFKEMFDPGTGYMEPQRENTSRFNLLSSIFRPTKEIKGVYKVISEENDFFLMRSRFKNFISFDLESPLKPEDEKDLSDFTLYIFNRMGRWHAEQNSLSEYRDFILSNPDLVYSAINDFQIKFLQILTQNNKGS